MVFFSFCSTILFISNQTKTLKTCLATESALKFSDLGIKLNLIDTNIEAQIAMSAKIPWIADIGELLMIVLMRC